MHLVHTQSRYDPSQFDRQLPTNVDAEQALLGAIILNNEAFYRVSEITKPEHFSEAVHQVMYRCMVDMLNRPDPILVTPVTMKAYLRNVDLGSISPMQYLARLAAEATSVANCRDYAKTISDLAARRAVIEATKRISDIAYDAGPDLPFETIYAELEAEMDRLRPKTGQQDRYTSLEGAAALTMQGAANAYKHGHKMLGLSTGLERLDLLIGGMMPPDFIVLAGRPGSGKTALALNIARAVAEKLTDGVVGISSLEMDKVQLTDRMIASASGISSWKIKRGLFDEGEYLRMEDTRRRIEKLPIKIDDAPTTIAQLRSHARNLKKQHGLKLLVVDYLQMVQGTGRNAENPYARVTEVSAGLKAIAKEVEVPVLALSQLSRKVDERDDKRPQMSDLRESGAIEQDADQILMLYREEYYLRKSEPEKDTDRHLMWSYKMAACKGVAEAILEKNRHGPTGVATLGFDAEMITFTNEPTPREEVYLSKPKGNQRVSKPSINAEGWLLHGALESMTAAGEGQPPTPEQLEADSRITEAMRLIPMERARDRFQRDAMLPDDKPETVLAEFRRVLKTLTKNGLALATGQPPAGPFYIVSLRKDQR